VQNRSTPRFIPGVAFRFLRRSGSRVSIRNPVRRNGCLAPSLSRNCMPPRTTRKSYRRTVSDRTMVGTAQPLCLSRPKPKGIVTTSRWTWEQRNSKRLIATRGWMTRSLPVGGEVFFLTSLFIERDSRKTRIGLLRRRIAFDQCNSLYLIAAEVLKRSAHSNHNFRRRQRFYVAS
jgi:hypothetical protein